LPDKVFTRTIYGKDVTVFLKKEFTDVMPSLKKENLRHHAFAGKTIETLFKPELIKSATVKTFNYSSSIVAWNEGDGRFIVTELPVAAQLSGVNAILCRDINKDGKTDLVLAGNLTECLPQFGRLDASYGTVLINKGNKEFVEMPAAESGLSVTGMIRNLLWLPGKTKNHLLFLRNNDFPVMYRLRE
jgi:hypothetical protein